MTLYIGVCEDDEIHRRILINFIKKILNLKEIEFNLVEFSSGEQLLENYPNRLDILFLDIQMGALTGIETAKQIIEIDKKVEIIFTTAVNDYIQEGYEVRAYRYLIKPLVYEDIKNHLNKCILSIKDKETNFLIISNKNSLIKIDLNSVLYIETHNRELIVFEIDKSYRVKISMRKIEKLLEGKNFFRCYSGFMVNLKMVNSLEKNIVYVNNIPVPVSKNRVKGLKNELINLLGAIVC